MAVGSVILATTIVSVGFTLAAAQGPDSTTDVSFVNLATPYALFSNKTITETSPYSAVVIGGTTPVPSDATTVDLDVEAGGTIGGQMAFYPAGNAADGSGEYVTWNAGGTGTGQVQVNIGTKNEVTFAVGAHVSGPRKGASANATTISAKTTVTITGYSTQVTDGDVSGLDGTSGQVLTNNGTGASWENPPTTTAYSSSAFDVAIGAAQVTVDSVNVPPGSYVVTDSFNAIAPNVDFVSCQLYAPDGAAPNTEDDANMTFDDGGLYSGSGATQMALTTTTGGTISLGCADFATHQAHGSNVSDSLIATPLDAITGSVINGPKK
jgi:hypothetical protein